MGDTGINDDGGLSHLGGNWSNGNGGGGHNSVPMSSRNRLGDHGVESVQVISSVIDGAQGSIGLDERVLPLHVATIPNLVLGLDVSGGVVSHSVLEGVLRVGLQKNKMGFSLVREMCHYFFVTAKGTHTSCSSWCGTGLQLARAMTDRMATH